MALAFGLDQSILERNARLLQLLIQTTLMLKQITQLQFAGAVLLATEITMLGLELLLLGHLQIQEPNI
jgi:hypothetical protein